MAIHSTMTAGVVTITIDRMSHRNTLNHEDFLALAKAFSLASQDSNTRVVLLKGQPGIFCAGADLEQLKREDASLDEAMTLAFDAIQTCPKPIIAEVDGPAVAEGLSMLLYCDLVFASSRALFAMPSIALARTPRFGTTSLLMMYAGARACAEKLLLSEPISADEALAMHLVTAVYDEADLEKVVAAKAARLAVMPREAVSRMKSLMKAVIDDRVAPYIDLENSVYEAQRQSDEAKEALEALMENRKPVYN